MQFDGIRCVRFGWTAIDDSFTFEAPPFTRCGFTLHHVHKPVVFDVDAIRDGEAAQRELRPQIVRHVAQLGDAVDRLMPVDPEPHRQLRPQASVIQRAQAALVELQRTRIKRQPAAIGRYHTVRDHSVGVQLRIQRPRRVLTEHTYRDAVRVDHHDLAIDPKPGVRVAFHPADHGVNGGVVRGDDLGT